MADTFPGLGRTVMELATDSSSFFGDIKKAKSEVQDLGGTFQRTGKDLQGFTANIGRAGKESASAGTQMERSFSNVEKTTQRLGVSLKSLGGLILGAFSVSAIKSAIGGFIDFTGSLSDLSNKTGIGVEELQKLKYAAELGGGSLETVTGAIGKMAKALVEGDAGAVAATKRLGLNLNELRQMDPGTAFAKIAEEIAKIPNPMEQSTLAMQLFGKSGADVLPMIKGGLTEAMQAAERLGIVMDAETVAAGDRLGDSLTTLSAVGQGAIGKVLAPMVPALQLVADSMTGVGDLVTWLQGAFQTLLKWGVQAIKFFLDAAIKVTEFAAAVPILGKNMRDVDKTVLEAAKGWSVWFDDMAKGFDVVMPKATKQTTTLKTAVGLLTDEQKKGIKTAEDYGKAQDKAAAMGVAAYKKFHDAIARVNDDIGTLVRDRLTALGDRARQVLEDATASTARMIDVLAHGLPVTNELLLKYGLIAEKAETLGERAEIGMKPFVDATTKATGRLRDLSTALGNLGQVSGESFGRVARDLATLIAALDVGKTAGTGLKHGFGQLSGENRNLASGFNEIAVSAMSAVSAFLQATASGNTLMKTLSGAAVGAQTGSAFGPIGTAIGAGVGALGGLFRGLFGSAGRDAVKFFAESRGGFDVLQTQLGKLGAAGQEIWKALTQGVGRNNPEQAARTIEMAKAKIEELERAQAEFNTTLSTSLQRVRDLGGGIPDALRPYLDDLRTAGRLTQENLDLLDELAGGGSISWQMLEEAAERYGASTDALGGSFHAMKLHDAWQQIIDDIDLFARGGADVNALLVDMSDEISGLVQDSIKFGTEIPENMRPWIERLIASGQLLDENGEKITDIGKLTFGETLQTSLEKLTLEIRQLILTLGGVPAAIDAIPTSVDVDVNYRERRTQVPGDDVPPVQASTDAQHATVGGRVIAGLTRWADARLASVQVSDLQLSGAPA